MPTRPKVSERTDADVEYSKALEIIDVQRKANEAMQARVAQLEAALRGLADVSGPNPCWCELPLKRPGHSDECIAARVALLQPRPGWPDVARKKL